MKLTQTTIEKTFCVEHEGKEYSVSFVNSDGQTLALLNRDYWEVYLDGEELQTYVLKDSTEDEKKTAEKNEELKDKLVDFCRKIFFDKDKEFLEGTMEVS